MKAMLADGAYGKAEARLARVTRDGDDHQLTDLTVSTRLAGDISASFLTGDNAHVLPTDSQKNTVHAFAADGIGTVEAFGLRLGRHFVASQPAITRARVHIQQHRWQRLGSHSFQRDGAEVRTATVVVDQERPGEGGEWVVSGVSGLMLLNSTGSEFTGFAVDRYTTLPEADDRVLAVVVDAHWRHQRADCPAWDDSYRDTRAALIAGFTDTYSKSVQQTLYAMGQQALETRPEVAEVQLKVSFLHHLLADLSPFGLANPNEVFVPTDRPYGLMEGTVVRDDATPAGLAWW